MAEPYVYVPFQWLDEIVEMDEFGQVIYEKDEQGNIVYLKDRQGNYVLDPINLKPLPKPRLLQKGTRHSAARENHQEEGIAKAHNRLDDIDNWRIKKDIRDEINDKFPGNSGAFADMFDGEPNKIQRLTARAVLTAPRSAGTTVLNVDHTEGFKAFTEISIFDGLNFEDTLITEITPNTITVQPLENDYVKGAVIARSTAKIAGGKMENGAWSTYSIEVGEVV